MIPRILAVGLLVGSALAQNVVHYTTTTANVKYLFATAEPVLRLKSGDILDTNTLDCFGNGLKKPGDTLSMAKGDNPLAGPFYVETRRARWRNPADGIPRRIRVLAYPPADETLAIESLRRDRALHDLRRLTVEQPGGATCNQHAELESRIGQGKVRERPQQQVADHGRH